VAQTWVSFDAVKAQVSIVDVLRRYGLFDTLKQQGAQRVGRCPFHTDSKASFKVTLELIFGTASAPADVGAM
jgi:DNA primase